MTILKKNTSLPILVALIVMANVLYFCIANNEIETNDLPLPAKCYEMPLPNCTEKACQELCQDPKGSCDKLYTYFCCCPIS
uniref:Uncharacterized protein n=1 Tax=Triticum aestivum TaxID=4565 RepID=A0A3B6SDC4_WHEAT